MSLQLNQRISELEEGVVKAVAELDRADGSRIGLLEVVDSARSILEKAYGNSLTSDVEKYLVEDIGNSFAKE